MRPPIHSKGLRFDSIGFVFKYMQSVTTHSKQNKNATAKKKNRQPQLVINSLHFVNGELEACGRSTQTGVNFLPNFQFYQCYLFDQNIVNPKNNFVNDS